MKKYSVQVNFSAHMPLDGCGGIRTGRSPLDMTGGTRTGRSPLDMTGGTR